MRIFLNSTRKRPGLIRLWLVCLTMIFSSSYLLAQGCSADYEDKNGLVVIEAENISYSGNWKKRITVPGYTGAAYIQWEGADQFQNPGTGVIDIKVRINSAGTYKFQWRNKVGKGADSKEHNDTWLKFPDADDFYGEKTGGHRVYPAGTGKTPTPEGASKNGWFKVYLNSTTNWTWKSKTSDFDPHEIYVKFNKAGIYTMQLSARSDFHLIDRIVLSKNGVDGETTTASETPCDGSGNNTTTVVKDFPGRIAYSADGDEHDTDDWLASPWSLALLRAAGLDHKLTFFEYNNHVWGTTGNYDEIQDRNVTGLVSRWGGFVNASFYNVEEQETAARNKLVAEINKSTAADPLFIVAAGPIETIGRAVDAATASKLKYVTILSHSDWNNEHANEKHGSKYTIQYLTNKGAKYKRVKDQNGNSTTGTFTSPGLKRKVGIMDFLKDYDDDRVKWLWTCRKMPEYENPSYQKGYYDYSDAGMTYWLITGANGGGDENVTPKKTIDLLESFLNNSNDCGVVLNGINDFTNLDLNGFAPAYKDNDRGAIAVNSVAHGESWAAASIVYQGIGGDFDLTLTTLTEIDGESSYKVKVNDAIVGSYKNPEASVDYAPSTKSWNAITINSGDVIQVEFQAHTNGKIAEGNGTAYARGRWTQLELKCSNNSGNHAPTVTFKNVDAAQGLIVNEGYTLALEAIAVDLDGDNTISMVELFIDDQLIRQESQSPYEWGLGDNDEELNGLDAGNHTIKVVVTDDQGATGQTSFILYVNEHGVQIFHPIHDAYVEGSNGKNTEDLRVEANNRISYLRFDLSSLAAGTVERATLKLTVGSDAGEGNVKVYEAISNDWIETAINGSNAPSTSLMLDQSDGVLALNQVLGYDVVDANFQGSDLGFIIEMETGGNDVSFASKEHATINGPRLEVKVDQVLAINSSSDFDLVVYPNPSSEGIFNLSEEINFEVSDLSGIILLTGYGNRINMEKAPKGIYLLHVKAKVLKIMR